MSNSQSFWIPNLHRKFVLMSIKPRIAKGTRDFSAAEIYRRNYLKQVLSESFQLFGFEPLETPSFELAETLSGKYGDEGDRLIFKLLNSGEKLKKADLAALSSNNLGAFARSLSEKALRYDLTVPFARYVAQNRNALTFPFRRYQIQPVWRADRPQHGRFQEFYQCDADMVGPASLWQEVEVLQLYDFAFDRLHLQGVSLQLNHRAILAGLAAHMGAEDKFVELTVALDKIDKIGLERVVDELQTKGFSDEACRTLEKVLSIEGNHHEQLAELANILSDQEQALEGIRDMQWIMTTLEKEGLKTVQLEFNLSLARGLNYYTGMIVEVAPPASVKMGSIGGGGRYANLTETFGLSQMSGIGISFGFDRIYLVLESLGLFPEQLDTQNKPVFFTHMDEASAAFAHRSMTQLRAQGISCVFYPQPAKLKKQLTYAHQRGLELVILYGEEEQTKGVFLLKKMSSGDQQEYPLDQITTAVAPPSAE